MSRLAMLTLTQSGGIIDVIHVQRKWMKTIYAIHVIRKLFPFLIRGIKFA
jgi:hypothetical protein